MAGYELTVSVKDDGSIKTVASTIEREFRRASLTASEAARAAANPFEKAAGQIRDAQDRLGKSSQQAEMSLRSMHQAIGAMTMAFGGANPALAMATLHLSRFSEEMAGMPLKTKLVSAGIVGVATAAGAMMYALQETERVASKFAAIDLSASIRDIGSLRSGLLAANVSRDALVRQDESVVGRAMLGVREGVNRALGLPGPVQEQQQEFERLRGHLQALLPHEEKADYAQAKIQMAELMRGGAQQRVAAMMAQGTGTRVDVENAASMMAALTASSATSARDQVEALQGKEIVEANARRTLDLERRGIGARYDARMKLVGEKEAQEAAATGAWRLANLRALAKQEIDEQTTILRNTLARSQSALEIGAASESAGRGGSLSMYLAGMSPDRRAQYGSRAENSSTYADLEALQATNDARVQEIERTQTRIKATLQGYLAQNLLSERDYANQVRALDQELTMAKLQGLQQYGSALTAALSKAAGDYAKYTDLVRALDKDIRDTKRTTADTIAEMKQAGMSPAEALYDRERRANEALAEATQISGSDQIEALKRVQQAYKDLGLEAARSAAEQKTATQTAWATDRPMDDWRTTPGQHSAAFNAAWNKTPEPGSVGSPEWWAGNGNTYWGKVGDTGQSAQTMQQKVQQVGDLIVQAQERQRAAASSSADQAARMVTSLEAAANEAARLAAALASAKVGSDSPSAGGGGASGQLVTKNGDTIDIKKAQATVNDLVGEIRGEGRSSLESYPTPYNSGVMGASDTMGRMTPAGVEYRRYGVNAQTVDLRTQDVNIQNDGSWDQAMISGGGGEGMASGGIVPGPLGSARRLTAHGGEVVANPDQQARILDAIMNGRGGGSGGPNVIVVQLDGREILRSQLPHMNKAIANGEVWIAGRA